MYTPTLSNPAARALATFFTHCGHHPSTLSCPGRPRQHSNVANWKPAKRKQESVRMSISTCGHPASNQKLPDEGEHQLERNSQSEGAVEGGEGGGGRDREERN